MYYKKRMCVTDGITITRNRRFIAIIHRVPSKVFPVITRLFSRTNIKKIQRI